MHRDTDRYRAIQIDVQRGSEGYTERPIAGEGNREMQ